ncbi:MAG: TorF family putative porin [Gammaproteobacteria bacterium]|nr:TorF family putative porin [Gammaproteobacteria bacterium]
MFNMKKTILVAAVSAALSPLAAQAELSANIGATSNYMWRGVTQTGNEAAVQGGIDWAHDSGFYLGTWASNVNFPSAGEEVTITDSAGDTATFTVDSDDGGYELDLYGGYGGSVGELGYDVGLIYYSYIATGDLNFLELAGSVSYKWFSAGINYTLDGEADEDATFSDDDIYYYVGASFEVAPTWTIGGTIGQYEFDDTADTDYTHYQLDIGKSAGDWGDFTLSVSQADEEAGNPDGDDPLFFVSWGKSF